MEGETRLICFEQVRELFEKDFALGVFILMLSFIIVLVLDHQVKRLKISKNHTLGRYLLEPTIATLIGFLVILIFYLTGTEQKYNTIFEFDEDIFMIFFLPPIIFDAGYTINMQAFFQNIGAILTYAFAGTFTSAILVALMVYGCGLIGIKTALSF